MIAVPGYEISADPARLDLDRVHGYLSRAYWSAGIPRATVARAMAHSLCFGAYETPTGAQVGFARVVTDHATFAYLCDVFVLESHRGRGLGKALVRAVVDHPSLTGARRVMLATRDAHDLYRPFGFAEVGSGPALMQILRPDLYRA